MRKGKVYISDYPENPPDWYWTAGLHDACIIGVEALEFPFDYNSFVKDKRNDNRNLLTFKINASGALFNTAVREIRLFNIKFSQKILKYKDEGRYGGWRTD